MPPTFAAPPRIPRVIHQTARTRDLTWEERRLASRLRRNLPGWSYALWTDEDNRALIARAFPRHLRAYDAIGTGVMKADIARVAWLHDVGGFYFDTDYKLLRPIEQPVLRHGCVLAVERGCVDASGGAPIFSPDCKIGNAVIGAAPGHPLLADFLDDVFARSGQGATSEIALMKISGPHALTRFFRDHHARYDDVWLAPQTMLLPRLTLGGLSFDAGPTTLGAHLCWGSWRTKHRVRNARNWLRRTITALV